MDRDAHVRRPAGRLPEPAGRGALSPEAAALLRAGGGGP